MRDNFCHLFLVLPFDMIFSRIFLWKRYFTEESFLFKFFENSSFIYFLCYAIDTIFSISLCKTICHRKFIFFRISMFIIFISLWWTHGDTIFSTILCEHDNSKKKSRLKLVFYTSSLWTTIDTISVFIFVKTIFHREKLFHFSRFFLWFSCTPIDKISVVMFCKNDFQVKLLSFFSSSSISFLRTPFAAIVWITFCETCFS